jgi:hypothetical protein
LNPAALSAALRGDLVNALIASTPGGIERQEAEGQRALCASSQLPKEIQGATREQLAALGFKFGADVDDLFVSCTLPTGWSIKPTDHSMWSQVLDEKGRERMAVFYKAAFYDRCAFARMTRRYSSSVYEDGSDEQHYRCVVKDGSTVIHEIGETHSDDYEARNAASDAAQAWLNENRPGWNDPLALWD